MFLPKGAQADFNGDGDLNNKEEKNIPCQTIEDIEQLWHKYTDDRCGWYGEENINEAKDCRELGGFTLSEKLIMRHSIDLFEKRLEQCEFKPESQV